MGSYEENRVKWLIDKPGGLFLVRRRRSLRRAGAVRNLLVVIIKRIESDLNSLQMYESNCRFFE